MFYTGAQSVRSRFILYPSRKKEDFIAQFQSSSKAKIHILLLCLLPSCQESKTTLEQPHFGAPGTSIKNSTRSPARSNPSFFDYHWVGTFSHASCTGNRCLAMQLQENTISATKSSPVSCHELSPGMPSLEYEIM